MKVIWTNQFIQMSHEPRRGAGVSFTYFQMIAASYLLKKYASISISDAVWRY